ncbi:Plasminogen receptor [Turdus rufiventris]|nr:Plasminogen receptor [Turdus rufiventris]
MGFVVSKAMNDSLKGQQEFMRLQCKNNAGVKEQLLQQTIKMAKGWSSSCKEARAVKRKNPAVLLPILPLSFVFGYQYDMGYGTLLQRIKGEAENILDTQSTLLELPKGPITFEDLEKVRISQNNFFIEK